MKPMKTFKTLVVSTILLCISCSLGSKRVYYDEMSAPPKLYLDGTVLTVQTKNSKKHSSLVIYEVTEEVLFEEHIVHLKAKQGVHKEIKEAFTIDLTEHHIEDFSGWNFNWIDPDGKTTRLTVEK